MFMYAAPNTTCIAATVLRGRTFTYKTRRKQYKPAPIEWHSSN